MGSLPGGTTSAAISKFNRQQGHAVFRRERDGQGRCRRPPPTSCIEPTVIDDLIKSCKVLGHEVDFRPRRHRVAVKAGAPKPRLTRSMPSRVPGSTPSIANSTAGSGLMVAKDHEGPRLTE